MTSPGSAQQHVRRARRQAGSLPLYSRGHTRVLRPFQAEGIVPGRTVARLSSLKHEGRRG